MQGLTSLTLLSVDQRPESLNTLPGTSLQGQNDAAYSSYLSSIASPSGEPNDSFGGVTVSVGPYQIIGDPSYTFSGGAKQGASLSMTPLPEACCGPSSIRKRRAACSARPSPRPETRSSSPEISTAGTSTSTAPRPSTCSPRWRTRWLPRATSSASRWPAWAMTCWSGRHPDANSGAGKVYEYMLPAALAATSPSPLFTIANRDPQSNGHFGFALAAVAGQVAISGPGDTATSATRHAYLYDPSTGSRLQTTGRGTSQPLRAERLGGAIAVSGTTVIFGARTRIVNSTANAGAVYLFDSPNRATTPEDSQSAPLPSGSVRLCGRGGRERRSGGRAVLSGRNRVSLHLQCGAAPDDQSPGPKPLQPVSLAVTASGSRFGVTAPAR